MTSHGASSEPRVPEDGLPIGDGAQAGALSSVGLICFQTLTSRSLIVEESNNLSQLEDRLPTNLRIIYVRELSPTQARSIGVLNSLSSRGMSVCLGKQKTAAWVKHLIKPPFKDLPFW